MIFLTNLPKKPKVNLYDFVIIEAYPTCQELHTAVPGVTNTLRRFSAQLTIAVRVNLLASDK